MASSSTVFNVNLYTIPGQHIREYARATSSSYVEDLALEVKQYVPLEQKTLGRDAVTIIVSGGIGFLKELYEPFFECVYRESRQAGFQIRGIWIADPAGMGESALRNGSDLGNEPHWFDHSRDLLHLINHFREHMPRPLIGIGHSLGGTQIVNLALMHPRLLSSLVLIEPAIALNRDKSAGLAQCRAMLRRRESWPDRAAVEAYVKDNPYYARWDPRAIQRLLTHGFRDTSSGSGDTTVMCKTSKHLDLAYMYKPNLSGIGIHGLDAITPDQRSQIPDIDPEAEWLAPLYRPEGRLVYKTLPALRPSVQYILGGQSSYSKPSLRNARLAETGSGVGGSGGVRAGRVREHIIGEGQHTLPMDRHMEEAAQVTAGWIGEEMEVWRKEEEQLRREWDAKAPGEKQKLLDSTVKVMKTYDGTSYNVKEYKPDLKKGKL